MKRISKWIGIVVGGLILLLIAGVLFMMSGTNRRLNKEYAIEVEALTIPEDADTVARGEHLAPNVMQRLSWRRPGWHPVLHGRCPGLDPGHESDKRRRRRRSTV